MTIHTPVQAIDLACPGLLSESQIIELLKKHVRVSEDGCEIVGLEDAARALRADQPAHIQILAEVAAERQRQITIEGWGNTHDDDYCRHELVSAAICYVDPKNETRKKPPRTWPWETDWWKPRGYRRNFVRAIALLVANVELRQRNEV